MNTVEKAQAKEVWRNPASLHTPWIEVSNKGRVRSLPHKVKYVRCGKEAEKQVCGTIHSMCRDSRGRFQCPIFISGRRKVLMVHRLVAECFIPNPHEYSEVGFKDKTSYDCSMENLFWIGNAERKRLRALGASKKKIVVKKGKEIIGKFNGCREAGRMIGVSKQAVWSALKKGYKIKGTYQIIGKEYNPKEKLREQKRIGETVGQH